MKEHLSVHQRIQNAFASQEVETLKAIHSYLHARSDGSEWDTIWSKSEDVAWAHFFGRMRGQDEVYYNNVTHYDIMAYKLYSIVAPIYHEVGGKDPRPIAGAAIHTLVCDVVEVADDGQSARASYLTPGAYISSLTPMKKKMGGDMLWERYGSDFVLEDGEWKYLHEHVCPDFSDDIGGNWAADKYKNLITPPPPPPEGAGQTPAFLSESMTLHYQYTPIQPPQDTVPYPVPYVTLDDDNTYAKKNWKHDR